MSSQQSPTGYKRRSSGKRNRRPPDVATPEAVDEVHGAVGATAVESSSRQQGKVVGKSASTTKAVDDSAWYDRFVNFQRLDGMRRFIREAWAEIQKVIWPDREATRNLTLVVIAVSVALGVLLGGIDFVLFRVFQALP